MNRSAIWYLRELEAVETAGDLSAADALRLLFQDELFHQKIQEAILTHSVAWKEQGLMLAAQNHLAAEGRWTDWARLRFWRMLFRSSACWLEYAPALGQRRALRLMLRASDQLAKFSA